MRPFVRVVAGSDDIAPPLPTVVVAATVVTAAVAFVTVATEGGAFLDVQ